MQCFEAAFPDMHFFYGSQMDGWSMIVLEQWHNALIAFPVRKQNIDKCIILT